MTVPSPKTEHQNKPFRVVPVLPEWLPYLEHARDEAPTGAVYVIRGYRDEGTHKQRQLLLMFSEGAALR